MMTEAELAAIKECVDDPERVLTNAAVVKRLSHDFYIPPVSAFLHPVILYYKYTPIAEPTTFADAQRVLCTELGLKGRVLIAEEGINGTLAGTSENIGRYLADLRADERFADIEIKVNEGDENTFPKLSIKVRAEIVALHADIPLKADQDNHLSPADWKRRMESDPNAVIVDVRNRYESDAGKFEDAIVCEIEHFRELPAYVDRLTDIKDKTVLMYCTGGIRCEKASALFRSKGFKNVHQLHGGILTYQQEFGNEHWLGECFVFDQRMTVKVEDNLKPIGQCAHTGRMTSRFVNCLHDPCHRLFLLSEDAEQENENYKLCPNCLANGMTADKAEYKRESAIPARSVCSV